VKIGRRVRLLVSLGKALNGIAISLSGYNGSNQGRWQKIFQGRGGQRKKDRKLVKIPKNSTI